MHPETEMQTNKQVTERNRIRAGATARPRNLIRVALFALAAACWQPAGAIISERYLRGVHTFDCEGEWDKTNPDSQPFKLVMKAKESMIRIETAGAQETASPYQIVDGAIRFVARLPATEGAECVLHLPAGSLSCRRSNSGNAGQFIGLCLPES